MKPSGNEKLIKPSAFKETELPYACLIQSMLVAQFTIPIKYMMDNLSWEIFISKGFS